MSSPDPECTWLSAYIYFDGNIYAPTCDRVVLDVLAPFVGTCFKYDWITRYFFIRYGDEHGPHVRLRCYGRPLILEEAVRPALSQHLASTFPTDRSSQIWETNAELELRFEPYVPETERYGGTEGVALAETFFYYSSEAALGLLRQVDGNHASRLGKGLLATLVLAKIFLDSPSQVAAFCDYYTTSYLQSINRDADQTSWLAAFEGGYDRQAETIIEHVHAVWERLEAQESVSPVLDQYASDMQEVKRPFVALQASGKLRSASAPLTEYIASVYAILPSYVHMMNNRLGIPIPEEWYLSFLIARALNQPLPQATS